MTGASTQRALALAHSLGFTLAGVCSLEPSDRAGELREWLAANKHGSMAYLARNTDIRTNPALLLDSARSAIMVADLYASRARNTDEPLQPNRAHIARYARGRDYHKVMKKRLHALADALRAEHPDATFRAFVDTAPVPERELAARAGLGWIAKHTLLIHPRAGSYFALGGLMTTLELTPPRDQHPITDHCGSCTRCIDACPTGAITPYAVDARRCISYLTIERRDPIDPALQGSIAPWLFGCDICQQVCPHNTPRDETALPASARTIHPDYKPRRDSFDLLEVLGWNEADRIEHCAGTPLTRATLDMLKRNARIIAAAQPEP